MVRTIFVLISLIFVSSIEARDIYKSDFLWRVSYVIAPTVMHQNDTDNAGAVCRKYVNKEGDPVSLPEMFEHPFSYYMFIIGLPGYTGDDLQQCCYSNI